MEYLALTLIALLTLILYGQHKRIRYLERDVASLSKGRINILTPTPYKVDMQVSGIPRDNIEELRGILKNPRAHSGKGYYNKN